MCGGGAPKPITPPPIPPPTRLAELERGQKAPARKRAPTRSLRSVKKRAKGAGVTVAGSKGAKVQTGKT